jgi:hypothetical protein
MYYDHLPLPLPPLFLVCILGSCAIMHLAAKLTATATDGDDYDAFH